MRHTLCALQSFPTEQVGESVVGVIFVTHLCTSSFIPYRREEQNEFSTLGWRRLVSMRKCMQYPRNCASSKILIR